MTYWASQRGFTLLEVLLVVVLMAVLTGIAVVSLNPNDETRRLFNEREQLMAKLRTASSVAQSDGVEVGWMKTVNGYQFVRWDSRNRQWQTIRDIPLLKASETPEVIYRWQDLGATPSPSTSTASMANLTATTTPALILMSSGEATPGELSLSIQQQSLTIVLTDSAGVVEKEQQEAAMSGAY